ncbi:TetR/AcrR family transcriptional regulator [Nocardioides currus]|uniref:TetR/AcrR family transcriptional regulator n=1 Tax=Nocardioides currus TaxID=2133958 RepID=A0A2R7Z192_9ACTN|nr:TetR/AcrR family transcriptional regulator [Nocardioides currus]PUA81909.1 TetR/AcrR family transcriptional regulator [Nocardioides currus]
MTTTTVTASTGRRSQAERREETISRLLDAVEVVVDAAGYAHTTVAAVCEEAGLSQGALFRHFPHRRALLVATAERVAERQTDEFAAQFAGVTLSAETVHDALLALRRLVRSRSNQVWHELVRAARTDAELRADLEPALRDYHRRTALAASTFAGDLWSEDVQAVLRVVISYLDGENAVAQVQPDPRRDDATLRLLADLAQPLFKETS